MILHSKGYMMDYRIVIDPNQLFSLVPEYLETFAEDYPNEEPSWDSFKAYLVAHYHTSEAYGYYFLGDRL